MPPPDARHTHCVFGSHEEDRVANPYNCQRDPSQSLVEAVSVMLMPTTRLHKDKTLHKTTDYWRAPELSERAMRYAALDAEMTRRVGVKMQFK